MALIVTQLSRFSRLDESDLLYQTSDVLCSSIQQPRFSLARCRDVCFVSRTELPSLFTSFLYPYAVQYALKFKTKCVCILLICKFSLDMLMTLLHMIIVCVCVCVCMHACVYVCVCVCVWANTVMNFYISSTLYTGYNTSLASLLWHPQLPKISHSLHHKNTFLARSDSIKAKLTWNLNIWPNRKYYTMWYFSYINKLTESLVTMSRFNRLWLVHPATQRQRETEKER